MSALGFVWRHLGAARGRFVGALLMTLLDGLATAALPLCIVLGVMRIGQSGIDGLSALPYAAAVVTAILLRMVATRLAWCWGFEAGNVVAETVRNRLIEHMRMTPLGILQRWSPARLATLITEDGRWLNEVATFTLSRVLATAVTLVALCISILCLAPVVALALGLVGLASLVLMRGSTRQLKPLLTQRNQHLAEMAQRIGEYAEGIAVFRSFGQGDLAFARLQASADGLFEVLRRDAPKVVAAQQMSGAMISLSLPVAIVLVSLLAIHAAQPVEPLSIVAALFLALVMRNAFHTGIAASLAPLQLGRLAVDKMSRFLAEPILLGAGQSIGEDASVHFERVSFAYQSGRPVLNDLSFRAWQGEVTAIVGASGAGKSTLAALLLRFFDIEKGCIRIGGQDIRELDPAVLQAQVAMVSQDAHLFNDTLRANLLLGDPQATAQRLDEVIEAACLSDLLRSLPQGLDTPIGEGGHSLSGGERQRVAVARALLKDAPIIVLDEATSAMDPLSEYAIHQAFETLKRGRTVVVIAHRLRSIIDAQKILVMEQGEVVEQGTHRQLLDLEGRYARLWRVQQHASGWRLR